MAWKSPCFTKKSASLVAETFPDPGSRVGLADLGMARRYLSYGGLEERSTTPNEEATYGYRIWRVCPSGVEAGTAGHRRSTGCLGQDQGGHVGRRGGRLRLHLGLRPR